MVVSETAISRGDSSLETAHPIVHRSTHGVQDGLRNCFCQGVPQAIQTSTRSLPDRVPELREGHVPNGKLESIKHLIPRNLLERLTSLSF